MVWAAARLRLFHVLPCAWLPAVHRALATRAAAMDLGQIAHLAWALARLQQEAEAAEAEAAKRGERLEVEQVVPPRVLALILPHSQLRWGRVCV